MRVTGGLVKGDGERVVLRRGGDGGEGGGDGRRADGRVGGGREGGGDGGSEEWRG